MREIQKSCTKNPLCELFLFSLNFCLNFCHLYYVYKKLNMVWVSIPVFFPLSKRSGVGEPVSREKLSRSECCKGLRSSVVTVLIANPRGQNKYQKRVGTTALKMLLQHQCCIFKCNGYGDGLFVYSVRSSLEIIGWRRRVRTE